MQNVWGTFATTRSTATANTTFQSFIRPWRGASSSPPLVYGLVGGVPNWHKSAITHLSKLLYESGSTAHALTIMRPLNWTTFAAAVAANATAISLTDDPGVFSTNYKYPLPGGVTKPANVADNAIATNDWVAYQLKDGTWVFDTIASGTFAGGNLVLTTAVPNITGGGINAGQVLFLFGITTDLDPAVGVAHPIVRPLVSTRANALADASYGDFHTYHNGDPAMVNSDNSTAAGYLTCAGYYSES